MIIDFGNRGGGGGGTTNYNQLQNKPQINSITLTGNSSLDSLDIAAKSKVENGETMSGLAKQLYSPTGTEVLASFIDRTTAGMTSISTGYAKLKSVQANTIAKQPTYEGFSTALTSGHLTSSSDNITVSGYTGGSYTYTDGAWTPSLPDFINITGTPFENDVITASSAIPNVHNLIYTSDPFTVTVVDNSKLQSYFNARQIICLGMDNAQVHFYLTHWDGTTGEHFGYKSSFESTYGLQASRNIVGGESFTINYISTVTVVEADRTNHLTIAVDEATFQSENPEPGTYNFSYAASGWSRDLATNGISITGTPLIGDNIQVFSIAKDYGTLSSATPSALWSTSMNVFDKDNEDMVEADKTIDANGDIVASVGSYVAKVKVFPNLEDGYSIYSVSSAITRVGIGVEDAESVVITGATQDSELSIVHPDSAHTYVYVATTSIKDLCIHPKWSGYNDKVYEAYSLYTVAIPTIDVSGATLPEFIAVGSTRNEYDYENSKYIKRVESIAATEELIQQYRYSKVWGTDYVFDDNHIYQVLQNPVEIPFEAISNSFFADDFGFIGFSGTTVAAVADIVYQSNLVDKLRRDVVTKEELANIKLDHIEEVSALPTTGVSAGTVYSYDGQLYKYVTTSGYCGEWFGNIVTGYNKMKNDTFAYRYSLLSQIPNDTLLITLQHYTSTPYYFFKLNTIAETIQILSGTTSNIADATLVNTLTHNGPEVSIYFVYLYLYVSWNDNLIKFRNKGEGGTVASYSNPIIETPHYEIINNGLLPYDINTDSTKASLVYFDNKGRIIKGVGIERQYFQINQPNGGNNLYHYIKQSGDNSFPNFFAPTAAGTSGQILKSNGGGAPTWDNIATMIGGVTFWTGTQEQYDALATKSNSVVYLIKEDE